MAAAAVNSQVNVGMATSRGLIALQRGSAETEAGSRLVRVDPAN